MSKRKREPRYVALVTSGRKGRYYHFPDLPGFFLSAEESGLGPGYFHALERLQSHLDGLKAQGLSVPEPSLVREVMAVPANRGPHRIFDLGDLRALKRIHADLLASRRKIDEADAAMVRRYLTVFEGEQFVGEVDFEIDPGLTRLQELFGCPVLDFMYGCFPIHEEQARALSPFLCTPLQLDRYEYYLEAHDLKDKAPTQVT